MARPHRPRANTLFAGHTQLPEPPEQVFSDLYGVSLENTGVPWLQQVAVIADEPEQPILPRPTILAISGEAQRHVSKFFRSWRAELRGWQVIIALRPPGQDEPLLFDEAAMPHLVKLMEVLIDCPGGPNQLIPAPVQGGRLHLVGTSNGGAAVLGLAVNAPELTASLNCVTGFIPPCVKDFSPLRHVHMLRFYAGDLDELGHHKALTEVHESCSKIGISSTLRILKGARHMTIGMYVDQDQFWEEFERAQSALDADEVDDPVDFVVNIDRSAGGSLGLLVLDGFWVQQIKPGGLVNRWNLQSQQHQVSIGDRIIEVNGVGDEQGMSAEMRESPSLELVVRPKHRVEKHGVAPQRKRRGTHHGHHGHHQAQGRQSHHPGHHGRQSQHQDGSAGSAPAAASGGGAGTYRPGEVVDYWSASQGGWVVATVVKFNPDSGTYDLDIRPQAAPKNLRPSQLSQGRAARATLVPDETQFSPGERVEYNSASQGAWVAAQIVKHNSESGTYDLDIRPQADPRNIRRGPV